VHPVTETASVARPFLRFAPSPNGYLHLGHAASALINQKMARRLGGRLLLRIEDIDRGRSRDTFIEAIYEDLGWLGFEWEQPVLRQSQHLGDYQAAAERLNEMGLLYPCFASRAEINQAADKLGVGLDPDGARLYPGLHRSLCAEEVARRKAAGQPYAMRLDMDKALAALHARQVDGLAFCEMDADGNRRRVIVDPGRWGDVVLRRKDVPTSYHLSVVVDDARQGITHVIRGMDLYQATAVHRLLQELLGLPQPIYHHHELVRDVLGRKLSKSDASMSLRGLRRAGWTRRDVLEKLRVDVEI
jgi:glutamyl-Q tRNA(Asp) synthetase